MQWAGFLGGIDSYNIIHFYWFLMDHPKNG